MSKLLSGKSVIVTGAGRGIGRGHCLHLADAGASVVVNDICAEDAAKVASEVMSRGAQAIVSTDNIASRAGAQNLVKACVEAFGGLDGLVNNAGNLRDRSFLKMSDEEFDAVWAVHVKGTFWCAQEAALVMRDQGRGGAIVNTTSGAHFGSFGQTNYAAAKGAIASMTYTWALELARYGIRVNAIGPTGTTHMSQTYRDASGKEVELPHIDPANNGAAVVYLLSDRAADVSGQIFGTGGERLSLMVQPHYGTTLYMRGGWNVEAIEDQLPTRLTPLFGPLGMMGAPYPFRDGVQARKD